METHHKEFLFSWGWGCLCLSTTALRGPSIPQDAIIRERRNEGRNEKKRCTFVSLEEERKSEREVRGVRTDSIG